MESNLAKFIPFSVYNIIEKTEEEILKDLDLLKDDKDATVANYTI